MGRDAFVILENQRNRTWLNDGWDRESAGRLRITGRIPSHLADRSSTSPMVYWRVTDHLLCATHHIRHSYWYMGNNLGFQLKRRRTADWNGWKMVSSSPFRLFGINNLFCRYLLVVRRTLCRAFDCIDSDLRCQHVDIEPNDTSTRESVANDVSFIIHKTWECNTHNACLV